ncbi:DAG-kinase catalytic domain [Altererythrobacter epoxidivorans]|uniref:DAG-kinase catalytic domain n=1 Tax=Altererythrobacter epoxidivorans TaxID=361183 RepID=A0A0M4M9Y7_9SPHN|nr:diacylglycerol kinase family protein [Altererythrobacter epoxidivorans]ALE17723.1 DAG-kinase catalytic domain [Altererythrobacter epoxidivorans]
MAKSIYDFAQGSSHPSDGGSESAGTAVGAEHPTVGVIYNPRSHRNKGRDLNCDHTPHVQVVQPGDRSQLPQALQRLADRGVELLVINGGDGTVRDVLTFGAAVFKDNWPTLAVLPKGKTNALAVDLDGPADWSLQEAVDAYDNGRRIRRRPLVVTRLDEEGVPVFGFILGAGVFTLATEAGQGAHKLGAFNSLAVAVTTGWTMLQLFGRSSNRWRKGVKMQLLLGSNRVPMEHSGRGDPANRQILFASTLERFPAGLKPFGALRNGLKIAVLDQVTRRTMAFIPAILMGRMNRNLRKRGIHQLTASSFEMELEDSFILDGEAFPAGRYRVDQGPELEFVAP